VSQGNSAGNAGASAAAAAATTNKSGYTINRQAGILTLNATSKQHELVQRMLDKLKEAGGAQVLIEAKIIEVDLTEQYASGINWQTVAGALGGGAAGYPVAINTAFPITAPAGAALAATGNGVTLTSSRNANDILKLVEAFGAVRTLSSPRLHAINNQQSTLTFAKNTVYFQITVTPAVNTTSGGVTTVPTAPTISSTTQTVPIGIMMTMMPSIDVPNNEVTLSVRPTLSTIIDFVPDPVVAFEVAQACAAYTNPLIACPIAGTTNNIPEVQVRELDSTLKLKSGETMVIGGLMQQSGNNTDTGVPFAGGIPVLGNLFKNVAKATSNSELILLIKATIVNSNGDLDKVDRNIFHKFSDDPRPVSF
jgi:general secretion pathway protein D